MPPLMAECAKVAMHHYALMGKPDSHVINKQDNSPLTQADLQIDEIIYKALSEHFPNITIITEERSQSHGLNVDEGLFFLVDPIDGTREFINKRDEFTLNIALLENKQPIAGVICVPANATLYMGIVGEGATKTDMTNGKTQKICVREPDNEALAVVASRSHLTKETKDFIENNKVGDLKNAGSSLKFCLLAEGEADLYPRFGPTMEWDTAAGHAILLAAGGQVNDEHGAPLKYAKPKFKNTDFIAFTNTCHYKL